jgi:hypothetical protein
MVDPMAGGIVIAIVMLVALPSAVMLGGLLWTVLIGWSLDTDAEARAAEPGS